MSDEKIVTEEEINKIFSLRERAISIFDNIHFTDAEKINHFKELGFERELWDGPNRVKEIEQKIKYYEYYCNIWKDCNIDFRKVIKCLLLKNRLELEKLFKENFVLDLSLLDFSDFVLEFNEYDLSCSLSFNFSLIKYLSFKNCNFKKELFFHYSNINTLNIKKCGFEEKVSFKNTDFNLAKDLKISLLISESKFHSSITFEHCNITHIATISKSNFKGTFDLNYCKIFEGFFLTNSIFEENLSLLGSSFFSKISKPLSHLNINSSECRKFLIWEKTIFSQAPDLRYVKFESNPRFYKVNIYFNKKIIKSLNKISKSEYIENFYKNEHNYFNSNEINDFKNNIYSNTASIDDRYRALKELAIANNDHVSELKFYGDELHSNLLGIKTLIREQNEFKKVKLYSILLGIKNLKKQWFSGKIWLIRLYRLFSDFGRSLGRPFVWFFVVYFINLENILFLINICKTIKTNYEMYAKEIYPLINLYEIIENFTIFKDKIISSEYLISILPLSFTNINNISELFNKLLIFSFVFFFLLALRNQFKIK